MLHRRSSPLALPRFHTTQCAALMPQRTHQRRPGVGFEKASPWGFADLTIGALRRAPIQPADSMPLCTSSRVPSPRRNQPSSMGKLPSSRGAETLHDTRTVLESSLLGLIYMLTGTGF